MSKFTVDPVRLKEHNENTMVREIMQQAAIDTEVELLKQLNELVSRGLLVIERQGPILTVKNEFHNLASTELEINTKVRLVLKDQEYIENLEKQNEDLKKELNTLKLSLAVIKDLTK